MYIDNLTITGLIVALAFVAGLIRLTRREYGQRPRAIGE